MRLIVNTDGGARGNPGPAGIGVVIWKCDDELETICELGEYIGETTNNQAEYKALIKALEMINGIIEPDQDDNKVEFRLDSELVVKQVKGEYKMKNEGLKPLLEIVKRLVNRVDAECCFKHIPREKNREADALVNKAIDSFVAR